MTTSQQYFEPKGSSHPGYIHRNYFPEKKDEDKEWLREKQSKFQFGTRVETKCGKRGIALFQSTNIDQCRVYYDKRGKTYPIMVKMSECRILTFEEAKFI